MSYVPKVGDEYQNNTSQRMPVFVDDFGDERATIVLRHSGPDPHNNATYKIECVKGV